MCLYKNVNRKQEEKMPSKDKVDIPVKTKQTHKWFSELTNTTKFTLSDLY